MIEQQLVATSIQVVLNTDEALSNEGLENKFSIVSTDGTNAGHVLLLASKDNIQKFSTGESRSFDIMQPVTDICIETSGKSFEVAKAICVFNFGFISEEARDKELEGDPSQYGAPFGSLPGIICKIFIYNFDTNTFGGFYFWDSETAMHDYVDGKEESLVHLGEENIYVKRWLSTREDLIHQRFETFLIK